MLPTKLASSTWKEVTDHESDLVIHTLLAQMHPALVKGLIRGDIMAAMFEDPDKLKQVRQEHALKQVPGQYAQIVHRNMLILDPGTAATQMTMQRAYLPDPHGGQGLTMQEMLDLYDTGKAYRFDTKLAMEIDQKDTSYDRTKTVADYIAGYRRFWPSANAEAKLEQFLDALQVRFINRIRRQKQAAFAQNVPCHEGNEPMRRLLLEIGYGTNTRAEADRHSRLGNSNNLFAWYNCMLEVISGNNWDWQRLMINAVPNDNLATAGDQGRAADVGTSALACSFWFTGGLNPAFAAGGGLQNVQIEKAEKRLLATFNHVYKAKGRLRSNIRKDAEKVKIALAAEEVAINQIQERKKIADRKEELKARVKEIEDLLEEARDIQMMTFMEEISTAYKKARREGDTPSEGSEGSLSGEAEMQYVGPGTMSLAEQLSQSLDALPEDVGVQDNENVTDVSDLEEDLGGDLDSDNSSEGHSGASVA